MNVLRRDALSGHTLITSDRCETTGFTDVQTTHPRATEIWVSEVSTKQGPPEPISGIPILHELVLKKV